MRKYLMVLLALTILFISGTLSMAQGDFEGKIKFKITHDAEVMFLDYFIKGENLRMEMGNNAEAVFIKSEGKSIVLMPEEKMYLDLDNSILGKMPGMTGMNEDEENEENDREDFDIDKYRTGKTKTILGYECYQWIFKDNEEDDEVEAWVTNELGNFMLMSSPMGGGFSPGWGSSINNNGFFPILVITRDEDGEENSRFEATEVNKQSLSNKLFNPPSNFSEMKIPGMDNLFK
jgi:Domain of unknown function (DUF4412)